MQILKHVTVWLSEGVCRFSGYDTRPLSGKLRLGMPNCSNCGAPTQLFVAELPTSVKCDRSIRKGFEARAGGHGEGGRTN